MTTHDERLLERYPGPDPSEAMIRAGTDARSEQWWGQTAMVTAIWRAMQAAAPSTSVQSAASTFNATGDSLKVAEAVREVCAKVAETEFAASQWHPERRNAGFAIAAAIRAMPLDITKGAGD